MANEFYITAGLPAIDSAGSPARNAFYITAGLVANDYVAAGESVEVTDSGSGSDSLLAPSVQLPNLSDSGSISDLIANLLASLSVLDAAAGADTAQGFILVVTTDTGTGVDSLYEISVQSTVPDSGAGAEAKSITVTATVSDSGVGFEEKTILATLTVEDTGAGLDLISVLTEMLVSISDSMTGSEEISSITVVMPALEETLAGVDMLSALEAALSIVDLSQGADLAINLSLIELFNKLTVTFRSKKPGARRIGKKGSISAAGKEAKVDIVPGKGSA